MGIFRGNFYSDSLRMTTNMQIIFPEESNDVTPVVSGNPHILYLLHGLSGNAEEWTRFSKIEYYAKKYNMIIIMPEVQRSFYCDYPNGPHYFSYIADELPEICSKWFKIDTSRENTFIAGESMGGYGAVKIGLNRPEKFNAIASLSGVMDYSAIIRMVLSGEWTDMQPEEFYALHGNPISLKPNDDVIQLVKAQANNPTRPHLIQLCGKDDFLYGQNQTFRMAAEKSGYGHTYMEMPGDHEWPYWDKAIQYAIQFFLGFDHNTTPIY